jgi:hypothetical protein
MQQMRRPRRELRSRSCCRRVAESLRILLPKLLPPLVSSNPSWSQSGTAGHLRQQLECDLVPRSDDAEMATIEGRDFGGIEPLRGGDHRGIDGAQRQVTVFGDELSDANRVAGVQWLDCKAPAGKVAEEANLGLPAQARPDQIGDLGDDKGGDDERAGMGFQQLKAGGVMGVVGVDVGVEGPCVDDQRDGAISEARISSIRSETSLCPLRPPPAASSCRRPPAPRCCSSAARVTSAIVTPRRSASWRSRASRSSGSFTVVRRMGMPAYQGQLNGSPFSLEVIKSCF